MYREGPEGTPFHSLLAQGYVDGPVDVCLCLLWETPLVHEIVIVHSLVTAPKT